MFLSSKYFNLSLVVSIFSLSCAKSSDDGSDSVPVTDSTTLVTSAEVSTSAAGSAQTSVTSALTSGDSSSNDSASALVTDLGLESKITRTRSCTADATAKSATVVLTFSGNESSVSPTKVTNTEVSSGRESRVWTNANNAVVCTAKKEYALVNWKAAIGTAPVSGVNGLNLVDNVARIQIYTRSFVNKAGVTKTGTIECGTTGTHTINWSGLTTSSTGPTNTAYTSVKSVVSSVVKTEKLTKSDGTSTLLDATHATLTGAPLNVTTSRTALGVPLSHTINSGTLTMLKTGAFYITNAFTSVVFDLTSVDPCIPTSGTMVQSIYKSSSATDIAAALKTLTYTFTANTVAVTSSLATDDASVLTEQATANMNHKCDLKAGE